MTPALFNDVSSTAVTTYQECTHKFAKGSSSKQNSWNPDHRGVKIPDARSSGSKKFCTFAPDICVNSVWKFLLITQHASRTLRRLLGLWKIFVTPALFNDVSSTAVTTYQECTHKFAEGSSSKENSWNPKHRGVKILDARSSGPKKFCTFAPDICVNSVWKFLLVTQHAPRVLR